MGRGARRCRPARSYAVVMHNRHPDRQVQTHAALQAWVGVQSLAGDKSGKGRDEVWAARYEIYLTNPAEQPDPEQ